MVGAVQQPLTLPPFDEPEPDAAIVIGSNRNYRDHHPGASDVTCVIEVADSSLKRVRTTKLRIYASSRIQTYVIINLLDRLIEVQSQPIKGKTRGARYKQATEVHSGQTLRLPAADGKFLSVPVRALLP